MSNIYWIRRRCQRLPQVYAVILDTNLLDFWFFHMIDPLWRCRWILVFQRLFIGSALILLKSIGKYKGTNTDSLRNAVSYLKLENVQNSLVKLKLLPGFTGITESQRIINSQ